MTGQEVGTLRELNVQPGDRTEYFGVRGKPVKYGPVDADWIEYAVLWPEASAPYWRIISRAAQPIQEGDDNAMTRFIHCGLEPLPHGHARLPSGEVVDLTAITTPVGLLQADVQEALRAHGGPWEWFDGEWQIADDMGDPGFAFAYRVKPAPPKVEKVTLWGPSPNGSFTGGPRDENDTHCLTYIKENGKIDPLSVRMEAL